MKKILLISLVSLGFINIVQAQTYEFLNSFLKNDKSELYLDPNFSPLLSNLSFEFTESVFREVWEPPFKSENIPDIELFLKGISFEHLNNFIKTKDSSAIDFKQLDAKIRIAPINNVKEHLEKGLYISELQKPFINCTEEWALMSSVSYSKYYSGGGGQLNIYRKVNGKWEFYYHITMYIQ